MANHPAGVSTAGVVVEEAPALVVVVRLSVLDVSEPDRSVVEVSGSLVSVVEVDEADDAVVRGTPVVCGGSDTLFPHDARTNDAKPAARMEAPTRRHASRMLVTDAALMMNTIRRSVRT